MVAESIKSARSCLIGEWKASPSNLSTSISVREASKPKKVRFDQVRIHTHDVVLGDNPACSKGPPIELAWVHRESESFDLEEFERLYGSEIRRSLKRIDCDLRTQWLRQNGHTDESFARINKEVQAIKASRRQVKNSAKAAEKQDLIEEYEQLMLSLSFRMSKLESEVSNDRTPKPPSRKQSMDKERKNSLLRSFQRKSVDDKKAEPLSLPSRKSWDNKALGEPPKKPSRRTSVTRPGSLRKGLFSRLAARQGSPDIVASVVSRTG